MLERFVNPDIKRTYFSNGVSIQSKQQFVETFIIHLIVCRIDQVTSLCCRCREQFSVAVTIIFNFLIHNKMEEKCMNLPECVSNEIRGRYVQLSTILLYYNIIYIIFIYSSSFERLFFIKSLNRYFDSHKMNR